MSSKSVKLMIYQDLGESTIIDGIEAKSFSDFVIIQTKDDNMDDETLERMQQTFSHILSNKKVVVIPASIDVSFYGIEKIEEDDDRPVNSELQHEGSPEETSGHSA